MQSHVAGLEQSVRVDGAVDAAPLSIFLVMPRQMYFGAARATSIDLCVRDLLAASRFCSTTTVFAERIDAPFPGFNIEPLPSVNYAATRARANHVAEMARRKRPDIIIVQQHLPTAAAIARRLPGAKVVLQTHNFQKSYRAGGDPLQMIRRNTRKNRYLQLAGIIHVSRACQEHFLAAWPDITVPDCVVNNGLDFDDWRPSPSRVKEVLFVGRAAPEKGVLEAAQGLAQILPRFPDWHARFILSDIDRHPDYFRQITATLSGLPSQATIDVQQPFAVVKAAVEQAAIALVPSKWDEPFGRTALEAHAGGAALVSSGTGGLAEISGETAVILPEVTGEAIARASELLMMNEFLRGRLAHEGWQRIRNFFDARTQAATLDEFCEQMINNRHQRGSLSINGDRRHVDATAK